MKYILLLLTLILFPVIYYSQGIDITSSLKQVESGNYKGAYQTLEKLKSNYPDNPAVKFLEAVLTKDGKAAQKKYEEIYEKHPKSDYADAAIYRVFSYYYSLGYYKQAEAYLSKLKSEYPGSPYIKSADRTIPDEVDIILLAEDTVEHDWFTIQVGAFLNIENALKLKKKLEDAEFTPGVRPKTVGGSILNVVTVGKFSTEGEAKKVLPELSEKFGLSGRVVSLKR